MLHVYQSELYIDLEEGYNTIMYNNLLTTSTVDVATLFSSSCVIGWSLEL